MIGLHLNQATSTLQSQEPLLKIMGRTLRRSADIRISGAYRGVNLSGLEYGGTPPQHPEEDYKYLKSKGFNLVRLAFDWEKLQPVKSGAFDTVYQALIDQNIAWAKIYGINIILDCHNYGRRKVSGVERVLNDGVLTYADLNDLWLRLSNLYKNEETVLAYDLMNEPHDMPVATVPSNIKTSTWSVGARSSIYNSGKH